MSKKPKALYFHIPEDLHLEFKLWCLKNNTTMTDQLTAFISQCVYKDEEPIKKKEKTDPRPIWDGELL